MTENKDREGAVSLYDLALMMADGDKSRIVSWKKRINGAIKAGTLQATIIQVPAIGGVVRVKSLGSKEWEERDAPPRSRQALFQHLSKTTSQHRFTRPAVAAWLLSFLEDGEKPPQQVRAWLGAEWAASQLNAFQITAEQLRKQLGNGVTLDLADLEARRQAEQEKQAREMWVSNRDRMNRLDRPIQTEQPTAAAAPLAEKRKWLIKGTWEYQARAIGKEWMNSQENINDKRPGVEAIAKHVEGELSNRDIKGKRGRYLDWETIKREALTGITGRKAKGKK